MPLYWTKPEGRDACNDNGVCNKNAEREAADDPTEFKEFPSIKIKTPTSLQTLSPDRLLLRIVMPKIFGMHPEFLVS